MPRKIRQLITDLEKHGFVHKRSNGSHKIYLHPNYNFPVVISGNSKNDAKHYQERAVKKAIKGVSQ